MLPYIIGAAVLLGGGAYYFEEEKKKKAAAAAIPHPQQPPPTPATPGTVTTDVYPQPLPPIVNPPNIITLAQRILAKFYATADGLKADVYGPDPSGGVVRAYFDNTGINGNYDAKTKNAVMKYQQWADDNQWGGAAHIHIPDANGNWREYGDMDQVTLDALQQWTAKSQ